MPFFSLRVISAFDPSITRKSISAHLRLSTIRFVYLSALFVELIFFIRATSLFMMSSKREIERKEKFVTFQR